MHFLKAFKNEFLLVYSLKSVGIVTECISNYNDTNKWNDCLNLNCTLNFKMVFKIGGSGEIEN